MTILSTSCVVAACQCLVEDLPLFESVPHRRRRCGKPVEVVRHYKTTSLPITPSSWALCADCDAANQRLLISRSSPIVFVDVGSELNVAMEVAFHVLAGDS